MSSINCDRCWCLDYLKVSTLWSRVGCTPARKERMMWGRFKLAIFNQHLAISQKRSKIGTLLLWKANKNLYALCRMVLFVL